LLQMSAALETLPPDQRAVLQLILKQGRGYAELSGLLKIDEDAVRARAHAGLEALVPDGAGSALTPERRGQIADWLLGQQEAGDRAATVQHLEDSRAARRWAATLRDQLAPLSRDELPELPGANGASGPAFAVPAAAPRADELATEDRSEPAPAGDESADDAPADDAAAPAAVAPAARAAARTRAPAAAPARPAARDFDWERDGEPRRSSKLGGALLLGGVAVLVAVVAIVLLNRGGDDSPAPAAQTQAQQQRTTANGSAAQTPTVLQQVNLYPPGGRGAAATRGIAFIMLQGQRPVVAVQTSAIDPNGRTDVYAAWLRSRRSGRARFLGYVPDFVGESRRFTVTAPLPRDTASYDEVLVSRESTDVRTAPSAPTDVVLVGTLRVNRAG
jgi:Sigma-70, region 4